MFCPNCGANQAEARKFCTICGTNLGVILQALTGQLQPAASYPPTPDPREIQRQREMARGVKLTIIGGIFIAMQFFSIIFTMPFRHDSPSFFWMFLSLILVGTGISKIINARPINVAPARPAQVPAPPAPPQFQPPRPVFSAQPQPATPQTSSFEPAPRTAPSATEDDTQHLPEYMPPREVPK